uniref:Wzt carbohydrate-binding domain-containing protein n=1 Tax=Escherichia coli TaxID=562 RepID=UPI0039678482
ADRNRSHWSTSKTPSYTKSVSWQHHQFSLPVDLNSGDYLLSFGISAGNPQTDMTPLDRRYDSIILHVTKSMDFWGVIDLKSSFTSYQ